jgi:hypothetical protein
MRVCMRESNINWTSHGVTDISSCTWLVFRIQASLKYNQILFGRKANVFLGKLPQNLSIQQPTMFLTEFCMQILSTERRMHVYKSFAAFVRSFPYPISFPTCLADRAVVGWEMGTLAMRGAMHIT